jgi:hypothetical protein
MKFFVLILFLATTILTASGRDLPPVPGVGYKEMKKNALRQCRVPPQIAILPPQIDKDYRDCVNSYYSPDPVTAEINLKRLGKIDKSDKLISIKLAKGFIRAYEFLYETKEVEKGFFSTSSKKITKILICDDSMLNCYRVSGSVKTK